MDEAAPFAMPEVNTGELTNQWMNFLNDPRGRAALLSFGTQLMQPTNFGQTPMGNLGAAIGAGSEGAMNQEKLDMAQQEAASKQDLRGAQAESAISRAAAAEARANAAGANSANMATRLQIAQLTQDNLNERNRLGNTIRVQQEYRNYAKGVDDLNRRAQLTGGTQQPKLEFDAWLNKYPHLKLMMQGGGTPQLPQSGLETSTPPTAIGNPRPEIAQARAAIARGAPRAAVEKRLLDRGIQFDPTDLD